MNNQNVNVIKTSGSIKERSESVDGDDQFL